MYTKQLLSSFISSYFLEQSFNFLLLEVYFTVLLVSRKSSDILIFTNFYVVGMFEVDRITKV